MSGFVIPYQTGSVTIAAEEHARLLRCSAIAQQRDDLLAALVAIHHNAEMYLPSTIAEIAGEAIARAKGGAV